MSDQGPINRYWGFEDTNPLPVEDGIRSKSQQGRFARTWWASRWARSLTGWISPARMARARAYARRGQVVGLDVQVGLVLARVQGTRPSPYQVRIQSKTLTEPEWERVVEQLAGQAIYAAQLLNGEMPHEIEAVFDLAGVSLFPSPERDLTSECSCPDPIKPCKHIAAVILLVGEQLDEDPFLMFALRGRTREQIMSALRNRRTPASVAPSRAGTARVDGAIPLGECLEHFWEMGSDVSSLQIRVEPPEVELQVLRVLGTPTFAEDETLLDRLAAVYGIVSRKALDTAYSDFGGETMS